ncbi:GH25 family lysozyme [Weissella cibaria]|uniref:GH25 family lysozyme n=1 Tax=Weissella cibaria TaxID=137591 RepID=UPI00189B7BB9|nr:GH25 family lysozyme [Weissella cibaria]
MNKAVKLVAVGAAFLFGATFAGNVTVHADSPRYDMVDVSNHNGQMTTPEFIDMRDAYGVKAVTTKISEGTTYHDWTAAGNIRAAQEAGLYINGYHYLHATTVAGAIAEADYAVAMAQADGLPVGAVLVADVEEPAQMAMGANMQAVVTAFENEVQIKGGFRTTAYTMGSHLEVTPYSEKAWIASYPFTPTSTQNWYATEHGWQFNSKATFRMSLGVFDVNQLYDNFFTADQAVIKKNPGDGATVWSKKGVWYTDKSFKHKANGIKKHMGSYWSFSNGKLIKSDWTNSWGMYYWSDGDGKLVQGKGTWKGYTWEFGTDGTYYVKNATPKSLNKLVEQLNK